MGSIQWTDETWNPVTGCSKVSAGCKNCYAEKMAERLQKMGQPNYRDGFAVRCHPHMLEKPIRWKRPRRIFVNSMSDLFHEDVPDSFVDQVFDVMEEADHHVYQVLTKRPERMRDYLWKRWDCDCEECMFGHGCGWPKHIWLGTSVEDWKVASRIGVLQESPGAVHFLSIEPLIGPLGPVDLSAGMGIDWVIFGGESGPGAREMKLEWIEDAMVSAFDADCSVFVKQLGAVWAKQSGAKDSKGGNPDEWPEHLRVREFPGVAHG